MWAKQAADLFPGRLTIPKLCFPSVGAQDAVDAGLGGAPASAAQGRDDKVGPVGVVDGQEIAVAVPTFSVSSEARHWGLYFLAFPCTSIRQ